MWRPLPGFTELDHQINDTIETPKVRNMAEEVSTKLEKSVRENGKRLPATINITLQTEGTRRLSETKTTMERPRPSWASQEQALTT
jgi:hypothetical protein